MPLQRISKNGSNTTLHGPQLTCNVFPLAVRRVGTSPMDSARSSILTLRVPTPRRRATSRQLSPAPSRRLLTCCGSAITRGRPASRRCWATPVCVPETNPSGPVSAWPKSALLSALTMELPNRGFGARAKHSLAFLSARLSDISSLLLLAFSTVGIVARPPGSVKYLHMRRPSLCSISSIFGNGNSGTGLETPMTNEIKRSIGTES
jgi:hypothetical protein